MAEHGERTTRARDSLTAAGPLGSIPPPPAGPSLASRHAASASEASATGSAVADRPADEVPRSGGSRRGKVFPFDAELECAELGEDEKPGTPWTARARTLSTSSISIASRRMCYVGRRLVIAVHRVDDEPLVLCGRVEGCRYEANALYVLDVELLALDEATSRVRFVRKAA